MTPAEDEFIERQFSTSSEPTIARCVTGRSATNVLIAPATRPATFGFVRRSNVRCGFFGQVSTPGGRRRKNQPNPRGFRPANRLPGRGLPVGLHDVDRVPA